MTEDTDERGRVLLAIARESLAEAFGLERGPCPTEPWLAEPGATFVTLMEDGELRGCVGSLEAYRPLGEDVAANAQAAAFKDTRFAPLAPGELPRIAIEVSQLGPAVPLTVRSESEALARLRRGRDGVILDYRGARATFLPQVWEQLPEPASFLAHLKHKAGLSPAFWSPEIRLWTYEVTKWEEEPSHA
ncbi:MAG TPA: AmmeMemoRadiSam system protein A [Thermoanaerobaculia bacterium]|nr:AmmeMemoRadiSam system protein A [Thermoanaerobaculia bacterium]